MYAATAKPAENADQGQKDHFWTDTILTFR